MTANVCTSVFANIWFYIYLNVIGAWYVVKEQVWDRHREPHGLKSQRGKNVVITGGTRGIGFEAVKKLLLLDCHIIMGCRNTAQAEETFNRARAEGLEGGTIEFLPLDLMSVNSVVEFSQAVIQKDVLVHVLINNAGIMFGDRKETMDGFESQLATNHLGHFLLCHHLLPLLEKTGTTESPSRIVNVSSSAHYLGSWMRFDDINLKQLYSPEMAYGNSKAAQIMFSNYLDAALQSRSAPVRVLSLHPGVVLTGLYTNVWWVKWFRCFAWCIMKTASQGGDTLVHASFSPDITFSSVYLENSRPASSSSFTSCLENQNKLWRLSCDLLGIEEFGEPRA